MTLFPLNAIMTLYKYSNRNRTLEQFTSEYQCLYLFIAIFRMN